MRRSCCPALPRMTRVPDVELVSVSRRGKGVVNLSEIVVSNPPRAVAVESCSLHVVTAAPRACRLIACQATSVVIHRTVLTGSLSSSGSDPDGSASTVGNSDLAGYIVQPSVSRIGRSIMHNAQRDIRRKKQVLEHAARVGNVRKTCRYFGIARSGFYVWKKAYETHGDESLINQKPCPRSPSGSASKRLRSLAAFPSPCGGHRCASPRSPAGISAGGSAERSGLRPKRRSSSPNAREPSWRTPGLDAKNPRLGRVKGTRVGSFTLPSWETIKSSTIQP